MSDRSFSSPSRVDCINCGTSNQACLKRIMERHGKACCSRCASTDTHPVLEDALKDNFSINGEPVKLYAQPPQRREADAEIPNRAPSCVWALRKDLLSYVCTLPDDRIKVVMPSLCGAEQPQRIEMTRKDARLLAKRINQCLDGTVK